MSSYTFSRSAVVCNTANDLVTIIGAANRKVRFMELELSGNAGTSAAASYEEICLHRSTVGTTPTAALTAVKDDSQDPTPIFTNATAWAVQPTITGTVTDAILRIGFNVYGGAQRWVCPPTRQIWLRGVEQWSLRPAIGANTISFHMTVWEE